VAAEPHDRRRRGALGDENIIRKVVLTLLVLSGLSGCTTTGTFVVPDGADLYINKRPDPVIVKDDGKVTTRPYFWSAISGVPYRLEENGKTVKEGKLRSKFRPVSIFWPPYGIIYWPVGLNSEITYDLKNDKQE
jgi:hypothetical protein